MKEQLDVQFVVTIINILRNRIFVSSQPIQYWESVFACFEETLREVCSQ